MKSTRRYLEIFLKPHISWDVKCSTSCQSLFVQIAGLKFINNCCLGLCMMLELKVPDLAQGKPVLVLQHQLFRSAV